MRVRPQPAAWRFQRAVWYRGPGTCSAAVLLIYPHSDDKWSHLHVQSRHNKWRNHVICLRNNNIQMLLDDWKIKNMIFLCCDMRYTSSSCSRESRSGVGLRRSSLVSWIQAFTTLSSFSTSSLSLISWAVWARLVLDCVRRLTAKTKMTLLKSWIL